MAPCGPDRPASDPKLDTLGTSAPVVESLLDQDPAGQPACSCRCPAGEDHAIVIPVVSDGIQGVGLRPNPFIPCSCSAYDYDITTLGYALCKCFI